MSLLVVVMAAARTERAADRSGIAHHFTITRARIWGWRAQKYS